jgi:ABC-type transporter Mla subunit MlaD
MKELNQRQALAEFSDRVTYVVTDLNGLISVIVNDEVTLADFEGDLTELTGKLVQVEAAINELAQLFWR